MSFAQFNGVASNTDLNVNSLQFSNGQSYSGLFNVITGTVTPITTAASSTPTTYVTFSGLIVGASYLFVIPVKITSTSATAPLSLVSCSIDNQLASEKIYASISTGITIATGITTSYENYIFVGQPLSTTPTIKLNCVTTSTWNASLPQSTNLPIAIFLK
jgi:hypothetical protein